MTELQVATPCDHDVSFYRSDEEIVAVVAGYFSAGLASGQRALAVATASHRAAIEDLLAQEGFDVSDHGGCRFLDAEETLATFIVGEAPDPVRFAASIGGVLDELTSDGSAVRVFGEMVALLWQAGNVTAALELESLWNTLRSGREFSLLCAYPTTVLDDASLTDAHDVCRAHSNVQAPRVYAVETASAASETDLQSEVFLPVPLAVPAARHFTTAVLRQWQLEALVEDAALIVTELGANAVAHAATPFRIRVRRDADTLRLEVHDTALTKPEQRAVEPADFHGRGLALIDALAQAWGYDQTPDGKRVWARLTARH